VRLRVKLRELLAAAVLAAAWVIVPSCVPEPADMVSSPGRLSLLALGDTGQSPFRFSLLNGQLWVARGLEYEDRRAPVDLMLLLGDNFYREGLLASELEERVRVNLVRPYCRFADLSGLLSARVASACTLPEEARHRVPILAVLGNHDYNAEESPRLQREAVPLYLRNWRTTQGLVETVELGAGVSLILLDSEQILEGADPAPLTRALDEAPGPWRILVTHRPIVVNPETPYARRVRKALHAASRRPQLILSGHEHNLQAWQTERPAVLHVIAGSGAQAKRIHGEGQLFAREALGFVRLDLVGDEARDERFIVSMFTTGRLAVLGGAPQLVARWSVDRSGRVRPDAGVRGDGAR
jgi:predicted phosphodiesterase